MINVKENASVTLNGMFPAIQHVNAELAMKLASPHMESILVSKDIFKIKHEYKWYLMYLLVRDDKIWI